jgi:phenylalanyl-tRNA synthetase alpha subunit
MVRLPVKDILAKSKENFEEAWLTYGKLIPTKRLKPKDILSCGVGKPHPVYEVCQRLRQAFLSLGFEEVVNPLIVEEEDVKKQYGPEALAILDRCYYLAVLPRPDVGLSKERVEALKKYVADLTPDKVQRLQQVLHSYKKGHIAGDDLIEEMSKALDVEDTMATRILWDVFPEFRDLKPEPTRLTLRSHMTTAWFLTVAALQHKRPKPIKLFSVDVRVRREQYEDETHLRTHRAASCVVVDEDVVPGRREGHSPSGPRGPWLQGVQSSQEARHREVLRPRHRVRALRQVLWRLDRGCQLRHLQPSGLGQLRDRVSGPERRHRRRKGRYDTLQLQGRQRARLPAVLRQVVPERLRDSQADIVAAQARDAGWLATRRGHRQGL